MAKKRGPRQRVGLPEDVQARLKHRAQVGESLLREVFSQAIRAQLTLRDKTVANGQLYTYLRAPTGLPDQLVELDAGLLDKVREIAKHDRVPVRTVLFNALVAFDCDAPPP